MGFQLIEWFYGQSERVYYLTYFINTVLKGQMHVSNFTYVRNPQL